MNPIELNKLDISIDLAGLVKANELSNKVKSNQSVLIVVLIPLIMATTITLIIKYINNEKEKRFYSRD
ncbi:hypothetical protein N9672_01845 [Flavobacteriaceae bacterium]|jgi:hypothetical protein|nr:hypothetical protein [Flavobacteriaceae bacterium]MDB4183077.1 hypothetical protein [Flavobacteriaceae bacterium]MDC0629469.1 hypothetical protein [Flavobacteriaceae bacterium]|tara:strand:+ start:2386 stop:2589 length:204 start_codon:yes stop_codon:yes gene_type:complete